MALTPEQIAAMDAALGGGLGSDTMAKMDAVVGAPQQPSFIETAVQPVKNIGPEIAASAQSGLSKVLAPAPKGNYGKDYMIGRDLVEGLTDVWSRALGAVEYVTSPITGSVRALASQPATDVAISAGVPKQVAENWIRTPIDVAGQALVGAAATKYGPQAFNAIKNSEFIQSTGSGDALAPVNKVKEAFDEKRIAAVQDLIMPKQTPSEVAKTALQRSSGGGLLNKQVYTPNPYESDMIKTVASAGVKPSAPLVDNIQILNSAKNKEAQNLRFTLEKANVPIEPAALNQASVSIAERIAANPLVDENGATVRKVMEAAQKAIDSNPKTAAGILKARQDFDKAITQFQPSAFDTDAPATAFRFAKDQIRQGMNDVIATSVPDVAVKESLAKQSHMYRAIDNMASKLSQEPTTRVGRFLKTPVGKATKYGTAAAGTYVVGDKIVGAVGAGTK